jgi:LmbE family N-acetylglucosaminyl deacetylase
MAKQTILAVGAHPDDIDFGASGTIAKWAAEGADVYYLVCTDGSRGSADPKMTHKELAAIRKKEQVEAALILGVKDVFFLDFVDTQLVSDLALKERIVWYIRKLRPQIVVTLDPTFFYAADPFGTGRSFVNHTDHRAAGLATMDAVFPLARDRLTFPEHEKQGLEPHKVSQLYFINMTQKQFVIDITETLEQKLKAIAAHVSQYDDFPAIKERMTKRALEFAREEEFTFAESFVKLVLPS